MTINVPLDPCEEAKLLATARAKGLSTGTLVREALDRILAEAAEPGGAPEPTRSLRGLLARYGLYPAFFRLRHGSSRG